MIEIYISIFTKLKYEEINKIDNNNVASPTDFINDDISDNSNKLISSLYALNVDLKKIDDCQMLSLILYLIERNHHFNGDGILGKDL